MGRPVRVLINFFTIGHDVVFAVVKQFMGLQTGLTIVQKRNVFQGRKTLYQPAIDQRF